MARKKSKTSAVEEALSIAVGSQWVNVDTDNKFVFDNMNYIIDESIKQYVVLNKPTVNKQGVMNDWTNEALMTQILAIDTGEEIRFFDENLNEVNSDSVKYV